jgi:hypothetical protein
VGMSHILPMIGTTKESRQDTLSMVRRNDRIINCALLRIPSNQDYSRLVSCGPNRHDLLLATGTLLTNKDNHLSA